MQPLNLHPKIKELKLRAAPITYSEMAVGTDGQLKATTVEDRTLKGYLMVWGVRDSYGTIAVKGCCSKSIQERGPQSNSKYKITLCWQHDITDPIGQFTVLEEDDYGLYFEAVVDDVPNGNRALYQVRNGTINQFSVGFDYIWDKMEYKEEIDAVIMREIDLFEGSVVTLAANRETYALRGVTVETEKELLAYETEEFIRSIPRKQQIELRQLISRQISLAKVQPDELRQQATENTVPEPVEAGIDYQYLSQNLKLF
jgi:HK97 family phage prohead protease